MDLFKAADSMIVSDSYKLSHCFGLAVPVTYSNGKSGEKVMRFLKSSEPVMKELEPIDEEIDTLWLDTDSHPGSKERIELLRDYYDAKFNKKTNDYTFKNGEKSPFVLTDDEAADRMTDTVWHWQGEPTELITALREIAAEAMQ